MRAPRRDGVSAAVQQILSAGDADGAKAARRLRQVVRGIGVDLDERPRPGWQSLTSHHPQAGYVVGIFPRHGHAQLVVEHGAALDGFDDLFDRFGKQMAAVIVRDVPDPRGDRIVDVVLAAVAARADR